MLVPMDKEFELNNKQTSGASTKTCYSKPKLENLGYVREMTLNGSGQQSESNSASSGMCADPAFKVNLNCM